MSGTSVAERQRDRAERGTRGAGAAAGALRGAESPKQRRRGLAALAVLLIVGGALAAGLLAVRMDSREPVMVAAVDIAPGTRIKPEMLREADVASEGLKLIPANAVGQLFTTPTYARGLIRAETLIDANVLTTSDPIAADRAIVAVPMTEGLVPKGELGSGDLVQVMRVSRNESGSAAEEITEALVLSVDGSGGDDELSVGASGSLSLLVPSSAAAAVVNAASADVAGLALLRRGQDVEVELRTAG